MKRVPVRYFFPDRQTSVLLLRDFSLRLRQSLSLLPRLFPSSCRWDLVGQVRLELQGQNRVSRDVCFTQSTVVHIAL